jgi:hypothetical protein
MIKLSWKTPNLSSSFAAFATIDKGLWQVDGRLWQLVVMLSAAYLCGTRECMAGMAAFLKTFSKRER